MGSTKESVSFTYNRTHTYAHTHAHAHTHTEHTLVCIMKKNVLKGVNQEDRNHNVD